MLFHEIIYGPIHSRRLGISLGINLMPNFGKVCTFDCIYCECGYNKDGKGDSHLPSADDVHNALEAKLIELQKEGITPDVFTFAGNGEPTLHPEFEKIIDITLSLRDKYSPKAKVTVLSNSTNLSSAQVFRALNKIDNNILKLDSAFIEKVRLIDAPNSPEFDIDKVINNLISFKGKLIVQTMLLRGEHNGKVVDNTTDTDIDALIEVYKRINPIEVMIYSIDRPTPEQNLQKVEKAELEQIAEKIRKAGIKVQVA